MQFQQVRGVILDWAGTTVDYGSRAPTQTLIEAFAAFGVVITQAEARAPMGKHKRDHIAEILAMPAVRERWIAAHTAPPDDSAIAQIFAAFTPRQIAVIAQYSDLIDGALDAVNALRDRGLVIASNTGYTRVMMPALIARAAEQGYSPQITLCADDTPQARPAPWMAFRIAEQTGIYPMWRWVKIGDTPADVQEGLNAGMWTIALAKTGNALGLSQAEAESLPAEDLAERLAAIHADFRAGGAHYVADALADVLPIVEAIDSRLAAGERP
jgi:phosphonoacetaldehyde hydrolase